MIFFLEYLRLTVANCNNIQPITIHLVLKFIKYLIYYKYCIRTLLYFEFPATL